MVRVRLSPGCLVPLTSQWSKAWHFSGRASSTRVNGLVELHVVVSLPFARTLPPWVASIVAVIVGGLGCCGGGWGCCGGGCAVLDA